MTARVPVVNLISEPCQPSLSVALSEAQHFRESNDGLSEADEVYPHKSEDAIEEVYWNQI